MLTFALLMGCFATVAAVAALGVASLIIRGAAARFRRVEERLNEQLLLIGKSSSTELRTEVDGLVGALDVMRAANRKEFGSLWARVGGKREETHVPTYAGSAATMPQDDAFEAMLALQSAPVVKPQ